MSDSVVAWRAAVCPPDAPGLTVYKNQGEAAG